MTHTWTKADLRRMKQGLMSALVTSHPTFGVEPLPMEWVEEFRAHLNENRRAIVLRYLLDMVSVATGREASNRATVEHFRTHPEVYGKANDEMIARFEKLADGDKRGAALLRRLVARIEAAPELPPEVVAYDPIRDGLP